MNWDQTGERALSSVRLQGGKHSAADANTPERGREARNSSSNLEAPGSATSSSNYLARRVAGAVLVLAGDQARARRILLPNGVEILKGISWSHWTRRCEVLCGLFKSVTRRPANVAAEPE